jgi:hypothetical protein
MPSSLAIAEPQLVESEKQAVCLANWLQSREGIASLDLETTGCNPKEESPIGKARVFCMTGAWLERDGVHSFYCPRLFLPCFGGWIESLAPKVGTNLFGFDRHALANEGYQLRGIKADTLLQSRLLNPDKTVKHGLKAWIAKQGWPVVTLKDIASRPRAGLITIEEKSSTRLENRQWEPQAPANRWELGITGLPVVVLNDDGKAVKVPSREYSAWLKTRKRVGGWPVIRTSGAEFQSIAWGSRDQIPLDELWTLYPSRRKSLVRYAVQDAQASLLQSLQLEAELAAVPW